MGKASAEDDDEYFSECFVDTGFIDRLLSETSSTSVIIGRTGGGKSAIMRKIKESNDDVIELHPENLSLGYLADSWLLKFLTENSFDLSIFYQQLWRHVLVVELLKFHEKLENSQKLRGFLEKLTSLIADNTGKKKAFEYLQKYGGDFWSDTDERVKQITDEFEKQVEKEFGANYKSVSAKYKRGETIGRNETRELVSKAQSITSSIQMRELARIIEILDEDIFTDRKRKVILIIDDLDRQWADDRVRIKLIEALINAIPKFRKIKNVKIVIAMRDDLLDIVLENSSTAGFQRDKFKDHSQRLTWKPFELQNLINRRVGNLFQRRYTNDQVSLRDLFEDGRRSAEYFGYICERTMLRPRDILAYFNMIFERCGGKSKITLKDIRSVELDYSKDRRQALVDEWRDYIPCVNHLIGFLGNRKLSATFRLASVPSEVVDSLAMQLCVDFDGDTSSVVLFAKRHFDENSDQSRDIFLSKVTSLLYRMGILGVRTQENSKTQFSFISKPSISSEEINENTWCVIHPMLWQNLGRRADIKPLFSD
ncbi:MAG: P-loop ATPase, Sll1717 family [Novosphingobium sp.]|uniref:P-loop ATPase, Sll1717 family n=1 Tax=Novosphingobium sp. TaxID=1874826 RepID=UPI003B9C8C82